METTKHEHKKQLHEKVIERSAQLQASLLGLQGDQQSAKSEHARAIEDALAALQTHLSGGWDNVDEPEAAAITRWLEASRNLCDAKAPAEPASSLEVTATFAAFPATAEK